MNRKVTTEREFFVVSKHGSRHRVTQFTDRTVIMLASGKESWSIPHITYFLDDETELKKQADGTFKIAGTDDVFTVE